MWSESEIQNCREIFIEKMVKIDFSKFPKELAAILILETQKNFDEFFEREKNKDLAQEKRTGVCAKLGKELELAQEIFADQEYEKIVEKSDLQDKIKKIILEQGPFTEIDVFVQENLNSPVLEDIFNDF